MIAEVGCGGYGLGVWFTVALDLVVLNAVFGGW